MGRMGRAAIPLMSPQRGKGINFSQRQQPREKKSLIHSFLERRSNKKIDRQLAREMGPIRHRSSTRIMPEGNYYSSYHGQSQFPRQQIYRDYGGRPMTILQARQMQAAYDLQQRRQQHMAKKGGKLKKEVKWAWNEIWGDWAKNKN